MIAYPSENPITDIEVQAEFGGNLFIGQDFVIIAPGGFQYWRVIIPDASVPAALLAREIFTFEGGGIEYRVFTQANATETSPAFEPIFISAGGSPATIFDRVTSGIVQTDPAAKGSTADLDWIAQTGTGNSNTGGTAGGQQIRIQPPGTVFYLSAENKSQQSRTFRLRLKWVEGAIVSKVF